MMLDTDVLIWYLRGNEKAAEAVSESLPFSVSVVTYMELLQGMRNKEEIRILKKAFREMDVSVMPINETISEKAADLVEMFSLSHSREMADALIAATCLASGETLFTANDKHYRMIDSLSVEIFRP